MIQCADLYSSSLSLLRFALTEESIDETLAREIGLMSTETLLRLCCRTEKRLSSRCKGLVELREDLEWPEHRERVAVPHETRHNHQELDVKYMMSCVILLHQSVKEFLDGDTARAVLDIGVDYAFDPFPPLPTSCVSQLKVGFYMMSSKHLLACHDVLWAGICYARCAAEASVFHVVRRVDELDRVAQWHWATDGNTGRWFDCDHPASKIAKRHIGPSQTSFMSFAVSYDLAYYEGKLKREPSLTSAEITMPLIHHAVVRPWRFPRIEIIRLLLESGAQVDQKFLQRTPWQIFLAQVFRGIKEEVPLFECLSLELQSLQLLLDHGADPNVQIPWLSFGADVYCDGAMLATSFQVLNFLYEQVSSDPCAYIFDLSKDALLNYDQSFDPARIHQVPQQ